MSETEAEKSASHAPTPQQTESGDDSDDESEVLEESPCGRWQKRREEVEQRDVPGIDNAFLAMDTEEGVEVVWNEVQFSEKKNFRAQQRALAQEIRSCLGQSRNRKRETFIRTWSAFVVLLHSFWDEVVHRRKKRFCDLDYVCNLRGTEMSLDKIRQVFDNLILLEHPNIVKFHKYWTDTKGEKPRVIFITEYMSSGSLKQFLKLTKKNNKAFQLKAWKRWCTQILSALSYLHSCDPPIIHGNLACDTIFIQHNGLIKIGSVAPDAIHLHVKTCRENIKNVHCIAPEYGGSRPVTVKVDIYAFGMCALEVKNLGKLKCGWDQNDGRLEEGYVLKVKLNGNGGVMLKLQFQMATLGIHGNGDGKAVTEEDIQETLNMVENPLQRDFLQLCIQKDPTKRPTARELLFHAVLFEVHALKLLAAHRFVKSNMYQQESLTDENNLGKWDPNKVLAVVPSKDSQPVEWKCSQVPALEVEKFLEDVKNGIYPLTAFAMAAPPSRPRAITPELAVSVKSETPEPYDEETRLLITVSCHLRPPAEDGKNPRIVVQCRMDDKMNRQLQAELTDDLTPAFLAEELIQLGFINECDREKVAMQLHEAMKHGPESAEYSLDPDFHMPLPVPSS